MIVYGRNVVKEAIRSRHEIREIRTTEEAAEHLVGLLEGVSKSGIPVKTVKNRDLDSWTRGGGHQGVAARIKPFENPSLEDILSVSPGGGPVILLDQVQDPRNFGAIARTALASGAKGLIMAQRRSAPISPVAVKASAGALFHIKAAYLTNLARIIDKVKNFGYWIYGAEGNARQSLYEVDFAEKTALVFGGEGKGLRPLVRDKCDIEYKIPMVGSVESLNVSVAVGVTLFELLRRR